LPDENSVLIYSPITISSSGSGDGIATLSIKLPKQQNMLNTTLYGRWYVEDAQAVNGYAISPLLQITLFSPSFGQAGLIFSNNFE
jgi:hypothetical protein